MGGTQKRMPVVCRVRGCRFPSTHVSAGHRCGTCGRMGHGQIECVDVIAMATLRAEPDECVPFAEQCTVVGCTARHTHTTPAHHCADCGGRAGTHAAGCARNAPRTCPVCRVESVVDFEKTVFTNVECCVCMDARPLLVFPGCRHAVVCADCTLRL